MSYNPHVYQEQFWKELLQIKYYTNYVSGYIAITEKYDRNINIFLAIASSGSICSWVIWNNLNFVWAFIIAVSQLINAIKQYLPFEKRKKYLFSINKDLQEIFIYAERKWFDVAEGKLENNKIHYLTMELKEKVNIADTKYFSENNLPENKKLAAKAVADTEKYFNNFYSNGE